VTPFTAELAIELVRMTISIIQSIKPNATLDDAISALEKAKNKTAQQYLDEARAAKVVQPPAPPKNDDRGIPPVDQT
jgi:hypothetical protein